MFHRAEGGRRSLKRERVKEPLIHIPEIRAGGNPFGRVRTAAPQYRRANGGVKMTPGSDKRCQKSDPNVFQRYSGRHQRKMMNDRSANARASLSFFAQTRRQPGSASARAAPLLATRRARARPHHGWFPYLMLGAPKVQDPRPRGSFAHAHRAAPALRP